MKKNIKYINLNDSNESLSDEQLYNTHKEDLGLDIPDNYFSKSRNEILEKSLNSKAVKPIYNFRRSFVWLAAASILLLISISVFTPNSFLSIEKTPEIVSDSVDRIKNNVLNIESSISDSNDILISSLFIEDDEIEEFVNDYIIEELIYDEVLSN